MWAIPSAFGSGLRVTISAPYKFSPRQSLQLVAAPCGIWDTVSEMRLSSAILLADGSADKSIVGCGGRPAA